MQRPSSSLLTKKSRKPFSRTITIPWQRPTYFSRRSWSVLKVLDVQPEQLRARRTFLRILASLQAQGTEIVAFNTFKECDLLVAHSGFARNRWSDLKLFFWKFALFNSVSLDAIFNLFQLTLPGPKKTNRYGTQGAFGAFFRRAWSRSSFFCSFEHPFLSETFLLDSCCFIKKLNPILTSCYFFCRQKCHNFKKKLFY